MAASSLLALIDDIATLLDDVAVLSKVAAKKTAGVLGDDLALNAQQVAGVSAERELPVVWAVAKGSFINKAILVPLALAPETLDPLKPLGGDPFAIGKAGGQARLGGLVPPRQSQGPGELAHVCLAETQLRQG